MSPLKISDTYSLPDSIVTETVAMLAKRGMGKSNAAVVLAEEMTAAGFQWVAIDPKGDWWGIRSSSNGKGPGLSVPIFGGRHGDVPLEASAGTVMANLIVERGLTCVLDVSLFSKAEQIRFVTDFAETLFRAISDDPRPLHLFLEEAEEFLPQRVDARSARMVGAYSKISKQGRTSGLGVTLITQRSASLNKDALSQTDTLVLFRTVSPHDRKAVVAWTEHHDESKAVAESLSELEPGESWIVSPGFLGSVERIRWRRRRTFDSGATPVTGAKRKTAVTLADIDLGEIQDRIADTIERAKSEDPKELRRRIAALEKQIKAHVCPEVGTVEIPAVEPEVIERLEAALSEMALLGNLVVDTSEQIANSLNARPAELVKPAARLHAVRPAVASRAAPERAVPNPSNDDGDVKIGKGELTVLNVLAQWPEGRTHNELAFLAGYSAKASTLGVILGKLRRLGYVAPGQPIVLTEEGLKAAGGAQPIPTGAELLEHWRSHSRMGEGERRVLDVLIANYPDEMTNSELCEAAGYSPTASTVGVILGKLRKLGLVEKGARRVPDEFMQSISA